MAILAALLFLNLVPNPGLEEPFLVDGLPVGWEPFQADGATYQMAVAAPGRASDRACTIQGTGEYAGVTCARLPHRGDEGCVGGGWCRYEGPGRAAIKLDYAREGQYLGSYFVGYVSAGEEWQPVRLADPPALWPEATEVTLACSVEGGGQAWYDDLYFYRTPAAEGPVNLLRNGGLESAVGARVADLFQVAPVDRPVELAWTAEAAHTGRRGIRLRATGEYAVAFSETVKIDRTKPYRFGGWVRCRQGTARIKVDFSGPDGWLGQQAMGSVTPGDEWVEFSGAVDLAAYPLATGLAIAAVCEGEGSEADFDDLSLSGGQ